MSETLMCKCGATDRQGHMRRVTIGRFKAHTFELKIRKTS